jgi:hypothetical protein
MRHVPFLGGSPDENPEQRQERVRRMSVRMGPPDNELPGVVPVSRVLARTDDLVVALVDALVYSTGIQLQLVVSQRGRSHLDLFQEVNGRGRAGRRSPSMLLGVAYPDGRTATNVSGRWDPFGRDPDDESPILVSRSGGGDDRSVEQSYWLWPVPSPGDLTVVCAWPDRQIAETRTVIPAEALARAHSATQQLWSWEPPRDDTDEEPSPPPPPLPDGWFKDVSGPGA